MVRGKLHTSIIIITGLFILMLFPLRPVLGAFGDVPETMVADGYRDTLKILASNYDGKVLGNP